MSTANAKPGLPAAGSISLRLDLQELTGADLHRRLDLDARRNLDLALAGYQLQRAEEARRVAEREHLLGLREFQDGVSWAVTHVGASARAAELLRHLQVMLDGSILLSQLER